MSITAPITPEGLRQKYFSVVRRGDGGLAVLTRRAAPPDDGTASTFIG
jgi:hypothetical protein